MAYAKYECVECVFACVPERVLAGKSRDAKLATFGDKG